MKQIFVGFFLLALSLMTACSQIVPTANNPKVLVTATPPALPESGKATVYGQVVHEQGYAMANTIIRLAEVARGAEGRGGAYILDVSRSPGTITDKNGYFSIQNVKAGEYVIVVGDVEGTGIYQIIAEANGTAKVWDFPADKDTNTGIITVNIVIPTPQATTTPGPYPAPTGTPYP